MGGRHKPFPPDDEAHPSRTFLLSVAGGMEADANRDILLLHWATELSLPWGPSSWDRPLTLNLYLTVDKESKYRVVSGHQQGIFILFFVNVI